MADAPSSRPVVRLGVSYAFTSTTLVFGQGRRAELTRQAAFASVEVPIGERASLAASAGGVVGGQLDEGERHSSLGLGLATALGGSYRVVDGRASAPLVLLTGTFSFTHAATRASERETPTFTAFDLRAGALVGKTIANVITPYLLGRVFGGPIFWQYRGEAVTGTDLYKYQGGAGVSLRFLRDRFDAFVEGVAVGERGVSVGLGASFF